MRSSTRSPVGMVPSKSPSEADNYVRVHKVRCHWGKARGASPCPYPRRHRVAHHDRVVQQPNHDSVWQAGDIMIASPGTAVGSAHRRGEADIPRFRKDSNIVISQSPGRNFGGLLTSPEQAARGNKALRQAVADAHRPRRDHQDDLRRQRLVAKKKKKKKTARCPRARSWANRKSSYKARPDDLAEGQAEMDEGGKTTAQLEYLISAAIRLFGGQSYGRAHAGPIATVGIKMTHPPTPAVDFNGVLVPASKTAPNAYA